MFDKNQHDIDRYALTRPTGEMIIHEVSYIDEFRDSDFGTISDILAERVREGFYGDQSINLSRKRKSNIDLDNPSTKWMYDNLPGFGDWHSMIPTAAALDPIYNPEIEYYANGTEPTPEIRVWLRNIYDAIGIRSRAKVMEEIIVDEVIHAEGRQKWASLACGSARPVFTALAEIDNRGGVIPDVVLADYDPQALRIASQVAQEDGFAEHISTKRINILKTGGIAYKNDSRFGLFSNIVGSIGKLPAESFDMVDAVGLLEYLKPDDWSRNHKSGSDSEKYEYKKVMKPKDNLAGAVTFLKNAYDLVRPGGMLMVGNMRETHPQLGFTLNVIQWPHIQPRSIEQMKEIFDEAGLNGDIDVYCPDDNVYAIYVIRKDM